MLQVVCDIYRKLNQPGDAMRVAMAMQDLELVPERRCTCDDKSATGEHYIF